VFTKVDKTRFRYVGQFRIAADTPFYRIDMPEESDPAVIRDGFVFRLAPVGQVANMPRSRLVTQPQARSVLMERAQTTWLPDGKGSSTEANLAAS
jgi:hypothetical protein